MGWAPLLTTKRRMYRKIHGVWMHRAICLAAVCAIYHLVAASTHWALEHRYPYQNCVNKIALM